MNEKPIVIQAFIGNNNTVGNIDYSQQLDDASIHSPLMKRIAELENELAWYKGELQLKNKLLGTATKLLRNELKRI